MNFSEYLSKKIEIKTYAQDLIRNLNIAFAKEHNRVCIGDIIEDRMDCILVEKITYGHFVFDNNKPSCIYSGPLLTKKKKPYKNGKHGKIYEKRLKTIDGVNVNEIIKETK